jgi:RND superfamily putative drug exporter
MQPTGAEPTTAPAADAASGHRFWYLYSRIIRWSAPVIVALWIGGTVASLLLIPPLSPAGSREELAGAVGAAAQALQAQKEGVERFGYPLLAQNVVVQYEKDGLSLAAQANTVTTAVRLDQKKLPGLEAIPAAVPVTDLLKLFPGSKRDSTTALTYLFFPPSDSPTMTQKLSDTYAKRYLSRRGDGLVGVTGAYQAEVAQGKEISGSLDVVEYASVVILLLVVGIAFRSFVAPVLTLFSAGMAYELSQRILSWATTGLGISVPNELDPIIVVLLLGIITDYSVFYLAAFRRRLTSSNDSPKAAVAQTIVEVTPLVLVASSTVAVGVAIITTARLPLFAALGPGLAISVGVAIAAVTTFSPAMLSLLRSAALWPSAHRVPGSVQKRRRLQYALASPGVGAPVVAVSLAGLIFLAVNVGGITLGINLVGDLPSSNLAAKAFQAAARGFAPGVVEPTEVLVESGRSSGNAADYSFLQTEMASVRGVEGVIGPANIPSFLGIKNAFISKHDHAARYLVILSDRPLAGAGIADLNRLEAAMPGLLQRSGLGGFKANYAGDTAISGDIVGPARTDILYVSLYVAAADLVMAILLLRSLLGPLILTLSSILVVASTIGLTSLVFPATSGYYGFTFYVPFATAVLLLSFGADYNLFVSGEIWENARSRRFRVAVPEGASRAGSAINTAGITLALSFSVLALVPLTAFRQMAFAMGAGLMLDTFIVRFLIVPAVLNLVGPAAAWPHLGHHGRLARDQGRPQPEQAPTPTRP